MNSIHAANSQAMNWPLKEIALACEGALHGVDQSSEVVCADIGTDSRNVPTGSLFVALRGERFDAHDFVRDVAQSGAIAAVVDQSWFDAQELPITMPLIVVGDTRRALGLLAKAWRARFALPLIGVAGSNGKTTVKEMIGSILRQQAEQEGLVAEQAVLITRGNLNNDIGVPLTLFRLRAQHRLAVVEMGMNHPGEIDWLAEMAAPTVALVNNAQREHLEFMHSVADVARENGCVYTHIQAGGVAVVNADDAFANYWTSLNPGRHITRFGMQQTADVSAQCVAEGLSYRLALTSPSGSTDILLKVPGRHNVSNALCAAAACLSAGCSLQSVKHGLENFGGVKGRQQIRRGLNGCTLIDDTYNANPDSVRAAIDVLAMTPGRKILVLGDMGEVGERAGEFHSEVGGFAKSDGIDALYTLGEHSALAVHDFGEGAMHFTSVESLIETLKKQLSPTTTVLVKGSRFMKMERVSNAITEPENTIHAA